MVISLAFGTVPFAIGGAALEIYGLDYCIKNE